MILKLSPSAQEAIGQYYENYVGGYQNDLQQRVNHYKTILNTLHSITHYLDQTYIKNNRNFIDVDNIATVEYEIKNSENQIVIKNIYFNNSQAQKSTYQPQGTNQQQQSNQNKSQVNYQPVPNHKEQFGLTLVKGSNGLFNFIDSNNQIFYPNQWFNQAYDFKQENVVCARVEFNNQWYLLDLNKKLYPMGDVNGYTNEDYKRTINQILVESSLNFMWRLLKI